MVKIKTMETATKLKTLPQQQKEAVCNTVLLLQAIVQSLGVLPSEAQFGGIEAALELQRKLIPLLPQTTQQWVLSELTKDKLATLPAALKSYARVRPGAHEVLYSEFHSLIEYLTEQYKNSRLLDPTKYQLFIKYVRQEVEAELTRGTTALSVVDGCLVFNLAQPVKGEVPHG